MMKGITSNAVIVLQSCCPKHPNKEFLVPNLGIFILARNTFSQIFLQSDKFKGTDFNDANNIFKLQPKETNKVRHFGSQIYGVLFLDRISQ